ncbi:hypothetical protein [Schlesneria paludicola]|uniref:hypothetical protein n=1 Tax=Schlesneria paludicola TaxID=360056 RepID=UPI00029AF236|nr:hypothetical protein [Schlesneria paludicola]
MQAFDEFGREVFPVVINTICPVAYAEPARQLALRHMTTVEQASGDTLGRMLDINLGPIGADEITHVFCSRNAYTHQVGMVVEAFQQESLPWGGTRAYSLLSDREEVKRMFCVVLGPTSVVLNWLGLEVKP